MALIALLGLTVLSAQAQGKREKEQDASAQSALPVHGKVTDGEQKLAGCTISLYQGNDLVQQVTTDKSGKYRMPVPIGHLHTMEFAAPGRMSKRVVLDTRTDLIQQEAIFAPMVMDLSLMDEARYAGADTDELDMPYAIVQWSPREKAFVLDERYLTGMMRTNGALLLVAGRAGKR
jgi:hypothetical protein